MYSFINSISKVDIAYCIKIKTTKTAYKKTFMKWFPVIHSKICMESVQTDFKTRLDRKPNINSLGNAFFIWFFWNVALMLQVNIFEQKYVNIVR